MTGFWRAGNLLAMVLALAGIALLVGCASPPPPAPPPVPTSYVALLAEADGSFGAVQLSTSWGVTVLDKPLQAARFLAPSRETFVVAQDKINQDFAAAMAASPAQTRQLSAVFPGRWGAADARGRSRIAKSHR